MHIFSVELWTLISDCWKLFQERQTSGAAWLGARLLLFYLRSRLKNIVKNCYPTVSLSIAFSFNGCCSIIFFWSFIYNIFALQKTDRVDDELIDEMLRAVSFFIFYTNMRYLWISVFLHSSSELGKTRLIGWEHYLNINNSHMIPEC